ncbi:hypothetical protein K0M31_005065 [Melipona bicolor]|uniref:Uncharacterized protein n=1 Tax=Melipona bicolor TaxID=60889 RepID=A0AA40KMY2_9HYME|nr:hypothetical protein K0M31_005065 [Melipona bicolor]
MAKAVKEKEENPVQGRKRGKERRTIKNREQTATHWKLASGQDTFNAGFTETELKSAFGNCAPPSWLALLLPGERNANTALLNAANGGKKMEDDIAWIYTRIHGKGGIELIFRF